MNNLRLVAASRYSTSGLQPTIISASDVNSGPGDVYYDFPGGTDPEVGDYSDDGSASSCSDIRGQEHNTQDKTYDMTSIGPPTLYTFKMMDDDWPSADDLLVYITVYIASDTTTGSYSGWSPLDDTVTFDSNNIIVETVNAIFRHSSCSGYVEYSAWYFTITVN